MPRNSLRKSRWSWRSGGCVPTDQPQALLFEQMSAVALQAHPYRVPIIGWMNDLGNMTVQDARDWYERWYVPQQRVCRG